MTQGRQVTASGKKERASDLSEEVFTYVSSSIGAYSSYRMLKLYRVV